MYILINIYRKKLTLNIYRLSIFNPRVDSSPSLSLGIARQSTRNHVKRAKNHYKRLSRNANVVEHSYCGPYRLVEAGPENVSFQFVRKFLERQKARTMMMRADWLPR